MAVIDHKDNAIVLGIVYDGPPQAGKTTSVRALARGFGREVYTPEERDGRTVYFDWLEHTGGRFDGAPIRCQIVSVPGQQRWLRRREHLLARADVVVFVGDTRAGLWPESVQRLRELRARLDVREGPTVGIVFQANRRDEVDAVGIDVIHREVGSERIAIVESVATEAAGIREAFVFAVRLALDRVREEQRTGTLQHGPAGPAGEELLRQLLEHEPAREAEARPAQTPASPEPRASSLSPPPQVAAPRSAQAAQPVPRLPSHEAPSGLVWPPVEGRIVLRDALATSANIQLADNGECQLFATTGFRGHSSASACFPDLESGRNELIAWARLHATAQPLLSRRRCIVLADAGDGRWRLWQIVRSELTLRELYLDDCDALAPNEIASRFADATRVLSEAQWLCAVRGLPLECTLDTIGLSDYKQPLYVGNAPRVAPSEGGKRAVEKAARELALILSGRSPRERAEVRRALEFVPRKELGPANGAQIGELLSQLLAL